MKSKAKLNIQENVNLSAYNTMALPVKARFFIELNDSSQLETIRDWIQQSIQQNLLKAEHILCIGSGSNIIFADDYPGLVIFNALPGIENCKDEQGSTSLNTLIKVGAGQNWDDFVALMVEQGHSGIENLSLIPGTVGACPIQNIGAYGQEVSDTIVSVETYNLFTGETLNYNNKQCEFAYRDSRFKSSPIAGEIITSVTFELRSESAFEANIEYAPLKAYFTDRKSSLKAVREAVIEIRESKLPNPSKVANTGSFFKNPVVSETIFQGLIAKDPQIPNYPAAEKFGQKHHKLAAGYLIEQCGFKGKASANGCVGMYEKQALVLVNHGGASANDVQMWANQVKSAVFAQYGVNLEQEPVLIQVK